MTPIEISPEDRAVICFAKINTAFGTTRRNNPFRARNTISETLNRQADVVNGLTQQTPRCGGEGRILFLDVNLRSLGANRERGRLLAWGEYIVAFIPRRQRDITLERIRRALDATLIECPIETHFRRHIELINQEIFEVVHPVTAVWSLNRVDIRISAARALTHHLTASLRTDTTTSSGRRFL